MKRYCLLAVLMLLSPSAYAEFDFISGRRAPHPYRSVQILPFAVLRLRFDLRRLSQP